MKKQDIDYLLEWANSTAQIFSDVLGAIPYTPPKPLTKSGITELPKARRHRPSRYPSRP